MLESCLPDNPTFVGIDIGGTKCAAVLGTADGRVLARIEERTVNGLNEWPEAGGNLLGLINRLLKSSPRIYGIGVSCGGPLDHLTGTVLSPPNLPGWKDVAIKDFLSDRFPEIPVTVENDANATALAELRWGAGSGINHSAYLTCGTGIGAGLILNGQLYRGKRDLAGEIGHAVILPNGPLCQCGKRGCLEAVASGSSIGRIGNDAYGNPGLSGRDIVEKALCFEEPAFSIVMNAAYYLGIGISNLLQMLDLERVILGSLAAYAGDAYLAKVRDTVAENTWPSIAKDVCIVPSGLGVNTQDLAAIAVALIDYRQPRSSGTI